MKQKVIDFLLEIGIGVTSSDTLLIYLLDESEKKLKTLTNQSTLPAELEPMCIRMTAGEYMRMKHLSGDLDPTNLNLDRGVKELDMGDTKVVFSDSSMSDEDKLNVLINLLTSIDTKLIGSFRRLRW